MEKNDKFKSELETQYGILITASEKNKKQRYIFLLVIILITYISVLISVVFSYQALKNSSKINKQNKETISTYYQTLSTVFETGNDITINNLDNGYVLEKPKIIKITNNGDKSITFNIKISSIKTSLISTNNLVYTLTQNQESTTTNVLPLQEKLIASNIEIAPDETITYQLSIAFNGILEAGNNTNSYQANIVVEQNNEKANLLE